MSDAMFSLADLAGLTIDDIQEVRAETLPQGSYEFEVEESKLEEGTNRDGETRFWAEIKMKIVDAISVMPERGQPAIDPDSLVGKTYTEKLYIVPEDAEKGIGRIRAWLADVGLSNNGVLGEAIEGAIGHRFKAKITHQASKDDKSVKFARLKLERKK